MQSQSKETHEPCGMHVVDTWRGVELDVIDMCTSCRSNFELRLNQLPAVFDCAPKLSFPLATLLTELGPEVGRVLSLCQIVPWALIMNAIYTSAGDYGARECSLVNLIGGRDIAKTSNNMAACTSLSSHKKSIGGSNQKLGIYPALMRFYDTRKRSFPSSSRPAGCTKCSALQARSDRARA